MTGSPATLLVTADAMLSSNVDSPANSDLHPRKYSQISDPHIFRPLKTEGAWAAKDSSARRYEQEIEYTRIMRALQTNQRRRRQVEHFRSKITDSVHVKQ